MSTPPATSDPWDSLDVGTYDIDKFYTSATDGHGHSATVRVKLTPMMHSIVARLVQSGSVSAYRTMGDVLRDALAHRLKYVNENLGALIDENEIFIQMRRAEIAMVNLKVAEWDNLIESLDATLSNLIRGNDFDQAEWLMDRNEFNEAMSTPYLLKLNQMIRRHRDMIRSLQLPR